jgi:hypothetical protein
LGRDVKSSPSRPSQPSNSPRWSRFLLATGTPGF